MDLTAECLKNLEFLGLDGLVVIGGDDTLSYGAVLAKRGVPVWGIPKTMDNDVPGTDYCIGFQTAISRAARLHRANALDRRIPQRDGALPHVRPRRRIYGARNRHRHLGRPLLIPEVPVDIDRLADLIVQDRAQSAELFDRGDVRRSQPGRCRCPKWDPPMPTATARRPTWPSSWPSN